MSSFDVQADFDDPSPMHCKTHTDTPLEVVEHPHNGDEIEVCPKCCDEIIAARSGLCAMGAN